MPSVPAPVPGDEIAEPFRFLTSREDDAIRCNDVELSGVDAALPHRGHDDVD